MASLNSFPSPETLVKGMTGFDCTDQWDVVVSYSLDKLNNILSTLWANDEELSATKSFEIVVKGFEPKDDYNVAWEIDTRPPTLKFNADKTATLEIPLAGTWQAHRGETYKVKHTLPDGYKLFITTSLMGVKVRGGEMQKGSQVSMGTMIIFDNDDNKKIEDNGDEYINKAAVYIVFEFTVASIASASCKLVWTGSGSEPTDADLAAAKPKLTEYLGKHIDALQYSLAAASAVENTDTVYLTPEAMTFTVVAPSDTTAGQGCLSIYMKTKDSGNNPGGEHPVFHLKSGDHQVETYPIPSGFTSSIIIRHKLFWDAFILRSLTSITDDKSQQAFNTVKETTLDSESGFKAELFLNRKYVVDSWKCEGDESNKTSAWRIYLAKLTFEESPVSAVIDNGQMTWDMSFPHEKEIKWEHDHWDWIGTTKYTDYGYVDYKASLKWTEPLLSADQRQINSVIKVPSDAWSHKAEARQPGFFDSFSSEYPGPIQSGIDGLRYPSFSDTMRLDYFATTNVFAPGKHVIDIDTIKGVQTPRDVLLLGRVVSPSELSANKK